MKNLFAFLLCLVMGTVAEAAPATFTYQGTLTDASDAILANSTQTVIFSVYNPSKSCLLYQESQSVTTDANGAFTVQLGSATGSPKRTGSDPALTMASVFEGRVGIVVRSSGGSCAGGYTTTANNDRFLRINVSGLDLSPDLEITSVPFSMHAENSNTVDGLAKTSLFRSSAAAAPDLTAAGVLNLTNLAQPSSCTNGQFAIFDGVTWGCGNVTGFGTVSTVSASAPLSVSTPSTTPSISMTQANGSTPGYVSSADWNTFNNKLGASSAFSGDVSGTSTTISVDKIRGTSVSVTAPTDAQALVYSNALSKWVPVSLSGDATITATGTVALKNTGTAGTYTKVNTDAQGRVTGGGALVAADIPNLDWTKITTGIPTTLAGHGITDAVANLGSTPGIKSGLDAAKSAAGTSGRLYVATDTLKIYRDNGATWDTLSAGAGSGITSLTGDVTATGPGSASATVANVGGVTAASVATSVGMTTSATDTPVISTLVKRDGSGDFSGRQITQYTSILKGNTSGTLTMKIPAVTSPYTVTWPSGVASPGQVLSSDGSGNLSWITPSSAVSGSATLASGNMWVGNGSNIATAVSPSGDVGVTSAGVFTVKKIQNTDVSATAPTTSGQILRYTAGMWTPNFLSMFDLRSTVTGTQAFGGVGCLTNQTLTWTAATDNLSCSNIAISATQVTSGVLPVANGGTGVSSLNGAFVLNGGQSGTVNAGPSDANSLNLQTVGATRMTINPSGFVGIGTTSPSYYIHGYNNSNGVTYSMNMQEANSGSNAQYQTHNDANKFTLMGIAGSATTASSSTGALGYNTGYVGSTGVALSIYTASVGSPIVFYAAGTTTSDEKMRIQSNGTVGIGTASPQTTLHTYSNSAVGAEFDINTSNTTTGNSANIVLRNANSTVGNGSGILSQNANYGSVGGIDFVNANHASIGSQSGHIGFWTANSGTVAEKMRILANGNVGIGTKTPGYPLTVEGNQAGMLTAAVKNTNVGTGASSMFQALNNNGNSLFTGATGTGFSGSAGVYDTNSGVVYADVNLSSLNVGTEGASPVKFFTNNSQKMIIDNAGNVGIGTSGPGVKLEVVGTMAANATMEGSTTWVGATGAVAIPDTSLNIRRYTLNANTTITLPAVTSSVTRVYSLTVFVKQDSTGNRTIAFAGNGGDTIKWESALTPVPSSTLGKTTIYQFMRPTDENIWYGQMVWRED